MAELTKAVQVNVGRASLQIQYSENIDEPLIQELVQSFIFNWNNAYNDNLDLNVYKLAQFRPFKPDVPSVDAADIGAAILGRGLNDA